MKKLLIVAVVIFTLGMFASTIIRAENVTSKYGKYRKSDIFNVVGTTMTLSIVGNFGEGGEVVLSSATYIFTPTKDIEVYAIIKAKELD